MKNIYILIFLLLSMTQIHPEDLYIKVMNYLSKVKADSSTEIFSKSNEEYSKRLKAESKIGEESFYFFGNLGMFEAKNKKGFYVRDRIEWYLTHKLFIEKDGKTALKDLLRFLAANRGKIEAGPSYVGKLVEYCRANQIPLDYHETVNGLIEELNGECETLVQNFNKKLDQENTKTIQRVIKHYFESQVLFLSQLNSDERSRLKETANKEYNNLLGSYSYLIRESRTDKKYDPYIALYYQVLKNMSRQLLDDINTEAFEKVKRKDNLDEFSGVFVSF